MTENDITFEPVSPAQVVRGALKNSDYWWSLSVNTTITGDVKVRITKEGIDGAEQIVRVYGTGGITYSSDGAPVADGDPTTKIDFTFKEAVWGLTADDIGLERDNDSNTPGGAEKGFLSNQSGDGKNWSLAVSDVSSGDIYVWMKKPGVDSTMKTVRVYGEDIAMVSIAVKDDVDKAPSDGGGGIFSECTGSVKMKVSNFKIAESETPYSVWYKVRVWAEANGYTFANKGREGSTGADGIAPSGDSGKPVTNISWRDAVVWCNAYSEKEGKTAVYEKNNAALKDSTKASDVDDATMKTNANGYRLPTEMQWEYAARGGDSSADAWNYAYAGTDTGGSLGIYAWYSSNSGGAAHDVKTLSANTAKLYDMSGNVREWCYDWFGPVPAETKESDYTGATSGTSRVLRGGSWSGSAGNCRAAFRGDSYPDDINYDIGFRVALPAATQ